MSYHSDPVLDKKIEQFLSGTQRLHDVVHPEVENLTSHVYSEATEPAELYRSDLLGMAMVQEALLLQEIWRGACNINAGQSRD